MTPASVLVYPLLDPDAVLAARDTLEEAFAQGESGGDVELEISEISGCIRFTDRSRIWKNEGEPPPDGPSAERAARSFIEQTERLTARAQLPRVFPADLHSLDASPVYTPEGERPDHWLVRLEASMHPGGINASGAEQSAPVVGGVLEVRVGANGRVVAFWSRWRVCAGVTIAQRLPSPKRDEEANGSSMVYALDGPDQPQRFLAPYYLLADAEGGSLVLAPASPYSLVVGFDMEETDEGVRLTAVVLPEAQGERAFAWAAWALTPGLGDTIADLGTDQSASLPTGVFNVVLDVEDRATHALKRSQVIVRAVGKGEE